jgi:cell division inhibitor SulA
MSPKRSKPSVPKKKALASRAVKAAAQPGLTGVGLLPELRQLIQTARHKVAVAGTPR